MKGNFSTGAKAICFFLILVSLSGGYIFYEFIHASATINKKPLSICGCKLAKNSIPVMLIAGILAQEDDLFLHHRGVNWRQAWHSLKENISSRRVVTGASTIDMQVAALCYLNHRNSSRWIRKFRQVIYALLMNRYYRKEDILKAYIAAAPLIEGSNTLGFQSAAEYYYRKPLKKLDLDEQWGLILALRNRDKLNPDAIKRGVKIPEKIRGQTMRAKLRQQHLLKIISD